MAKSPQEAIAKYNRNTAGGAGRWQAGVQGAGSRYSSGLGEFLGVPVPGQWVSSWQAGVSSPQAAARYASGTQNAGQKWFDGMRRAASGGAIASPIV